MLTSTMEHLCYARQSILFLCLILICELNSAGQENLSADKSLINSFMLSVSHGGFIPPELVSKEADTAKLNNKLRILGIRWAKRDYRRDSIVLAGTVRIPVEGTRQAVVLVYFRYRKVDWDELLLLVNQKDDLLMDIANIKDVFYFDRSLRLRYHLNKIRLYNYFFPTFSRADELAEAARTVVRLALKNEKDSLKQHLMVADSSFKYYFKSLGEEWLQNEEDRLKTKMESEVRKKIQENIASPTSLVTDGNFWPDVKAGTCSQILRCTVNNKQVLFAFKKKDSRYLLYKFHVYQ